MLRKYYLPLLLIYYLSTIRRIDPSVRILISAR
jgi:hypothetical protein